jgi:phage terminase small subunit
MEDLTLKQERFCMEFLIDLNAKQAAIRAGYSFATAAAIGYENLTKSHIQDRIAELNKDRAEATGITQRKVLEEYAKIAFFDIRKIYGDNGALLPISLLGDNEAGAIAGVKTFEVYSQGELLGENKEVKVFDKIRALEALGKHLGIFSVDNKQNQVLTNVVVQLGKGINPDAITD